MKRWAASGPTQIPFSEAWWLMRVFLGAVRECAHARVDAQSAVCPGSRTSRLAVARRGGSRDDREMCEAVSVPRSFRSIHLTRVTTSHIMSVVVQWTNYHNPPAVGMLSASCTTSVQATAARSTLK